MLLLAIPKYEKEGRAAALAGSRMSSMETPMGFTFCPYADGSLERYNFLVGATEVYFEGDKE